MEVEENKVVQGSEVEEKDLLNILKESALYAELTPDEQDTLLKYVADVYLPIVSVATAEQGNRAA